MFLKDSFKPIVCVSRRLYKHSNIFHFFLSLNAQFCPKCRKNKGKVIVYQRSGQHLNIFVCMVRLAGAYMID